MAEDKRTPSDKAPTAPTWRTGGTPIPVAELRFVAAATGAGIETPGPGAQRLGKIVAGVPAGSATGNGRYFVEFWPWMGQFRVQYTEDGRTAVEFFVLGHRVESWIPA